MIPHVAQTHSDPENNPAVKLYISAYFEPVARCNPSNLLFAHYPCPAGQGSWGWFLADRDIRPDWVWRGADGRGIATLPQTIGLEIVLTQSRRVRRVGFPFTFY